MSLTPDIPILYKVGAGAVLMCLMGIWHVSAVHSAASHATTAENERHIAIDAANSARANAELAALNGKVRQASADLLAAQANLQKLQSENDHEKSISTQYRADLLAGRQRLRILTAARDPAQAGTPASYGAAAVDQSAAVVADIDPRVAAGLESVRERQNDAVRRLQGCIAAYDSVKSAADALK